MGIVLLLITEAIRIRSPSLSTLQRLSIERGQRVDFRKIIAIYIINMEAHVKFRRSLRGPNIQSIGQLENEWWAILGRVEILRSNAR